MSLIVNIESIFLTENVSSVMIFGVIVACQVATYNSCIVYFQTGLKIYYAGKKQGNLYIW